MCFLNAQSSTLKKHRQICNIELVIFLRLKVFVNIIYKTQTIILSHFYDVTTQPMSKKMKVFLYVVYVVYSILIKYYKIDKEKSIINIVPVSTKLRALFPFLL